MFSKRTFKSSTDGCEKEISIYPPIQMSYASLVSTDATSLVFKCFSPSSSCSFILQQLHSLTLTNLLRFCLPPSLHHPPSLIQPFSSCHSLSATKDSHTSDILLYQGINPTVNTVSEPTCNSHTLTWILPEKAFGTTEVLPYEGRISLKIIHKHFVERLRPVYSINNGRI